MAARRFRAARGRGGRSGNPGKRADVGKPGNGRTGPGGAGRALMGLGIEMAVPIVLCMYVGYRVDRWLETAPWFFLVGSFLGIAISFYNLFRRVMPGGRNPNGEQR